MYARPTRLAGVFAMLLMSTTPAIARQVTPFDRLPAHVLDATPPAARVTGVPGSMTLRPGTCRSLPIADARRRIVELAVQEWGFFGFPVVEYNAEEDDGPGPGGARAGRPGTGASGQGGNRGGGRGGGRSRIGTPEAARTAASIGGYWAVTPGGAWILETQNEYWREATSGVTRWRFPWSAAFISWLMCEGGIGAPESFQRAIAHHTYIDQAIRANDSASSPAAYVARDVGEAPVAPGDMLCTSRQPVFRTIADRRRQMGQGARTHCDVVVKVDAAAGHILAIGGNVRGVVGLKILPAARVRGVLQPALPASARQIFAHLSLRSQATAADAFDNSPTLVALACVGGPATTRWSTARQLAPAAVRCGD
jgi:hypothetical protein